MAWPPATTGESPGTLGFPSGAPAVTGGPCDENEDGMQLALQIVLIVSSVLLILLILLHRGRGGGLSSLFGGGVQSSLSGSSVVEKNLDRLTLFVGAIWVIAIIGTGLLVKVGV
jgi:preprotein translocase subunit SecG